MLKLQLNKSFQVAYDILRSLRGEFDRVSGVISGRTVTMIIDDTYQFTGVYDDLIVKELHNPKFKINLFTKDTLLQMDDSNNVFLNKSIRDDLDYVVWDSILQLPLGVKYSRDGICGHAFYEGKRVAEVYRSYGDDTMEFFFDNYKVIINNDTDEGQPTTIFTLRRGEELPRAPNIEKYVATLWVKTFPTESIILKFSHHPITLSITGDIAIVDTNEIVSREKTALDSVNTFLTLGGFHSLDSMKAFSIYFIDKTGRIKQINKITENDFSKLHELFDDYFNGATIHSKLGLKSYINIDIHTPAIHFDIAKGEESKAISILVDIEDILSVIDGGE